MLVDLMIRIASVNDGRNDGNLRQRGTLCLYRGSSLAGGVIGSVSGVTSSYHTSASLLCNPSRRCWAVAESSPLYLLQ